MRDLVPHASAIRKTKSSVRSLLLPAVVGAAVTAAVTAAAPGNAVARVEDKAAVDRVIELNRKALELYDALKLEESRQLLKQALEVCAAAGLERHPVKARTHVHLGALFVAGFNQRELGIGQFKKAFAIQPQINLTRAMANPEIEAAFAEAKAGAGTTAAGPAPDQSMPPAPPQPLAPDEAPAPAGVAAEPDPTGIAHEPVGEAARGATITVRAKVGRELEIDRLVLAYRPEGASVFLARDMRRDAAGWHAAEIPSAATSGGVVAYYLEARNRSGQPVAGNASAAQPHIVTLAVPPPPPAPAIAPAPGSRAAEATATRGSEAAAPAGAAAGAGRRFFFGLSAGSGVGLAQGRPEVNTFDPETLDDIRVRLGIARAALLHVAPEVGFLAAPGFLLSLQGRFQLVSGGTEVRDRTCEINWDANAGEGRCPPAWGAAAVLARATWLYRGASSFRPYLAFAAGAGTVRHVVDLGGVLDICGPERQSACVDTLAGGALLLGPAAGFLYQLSETLSLAVGLNSLVGAPRFTLNFDLNVGVAMEI